MGFSLLPLCGQINFLDKCLCAHPSDECHHVHLYTRVDQKTVRPVRLKRDEKEKKCNGQKEVEQLREVW